MKTAFILGTLITMFVAISPVFAGTPANNTMNAVVGYNTTSDGLLTCSFVSSPMGYLLTNENTVQFGSGLLGVDIPGLNSNGGSLLAPVTNFTNVVCTYQCNVNLTTSKSQDRLLTTVLASDGLYHVVTGASTLVPENTNLYTYQTPDISLWTPAIPNNSSVLQAALVFTGYKNSGGGHKATISAIGVNGDKAPKLNYNPTTTGNADPVFNFEPSP